MSFAQMLLKLANVSRRYESPEAAAPLTVLEGISLEVAPAESVAIIGPSGSGKSTLLHIIGTLDRPSSGAVLLNNRDLSTLSDQQLASVRNQDIGFVFQAHYLLPQCTVLENVLVPTLAARDGTGDPSNSEGRKPESPQARAERLLAHVGLGGRLSHRPGQLSGGERQRVAVVRALINQPRLLLADEPTGSLDHASAEQLAELLVEFNQEEKVALIVVTHALDLARRMSKVFELKDGRLLEHDRKK
jgi:ABC-type lipoprotein export system ATPase subunit